MDCQGKNVSTVLYSFLRLVGSLHRVFKQQSLIYLLDCGLMYYFQLNELSTT